MSAILYNGKRGNALTARPAKAMLFLTSTAQHDSDENEPDRKCQAYKSEHNHKNFRNQTIVSLLLRDNHNL